MGIEWILLLSWILITLTVATFFAFRFTKSPIWDWIDQPYYLIGIIGIIFLFQSQGGDRKYLKLRDDYTQQTKQANIAITTFNIANMSGRDPIEQLHIDPNHGLTGIIDSTYSTNGVNSNDKLCSLFFKSSTCSILFDSQNRYVSLVEDFSKKPPPNHFLELAKFDKQICDQLPHVLPEEAIPDKEVSVIAIDANNSYQLLKSKPLTIDDEFIDSIRKKISDDTIAYRRERYGVIVDEDDEEDISQIEYDQIVDEIIKYDSTVYLTRIVCDQNLMIQTANYIKLDKLSKDADKYQAQSVNTINKMKDIRSRLDISNSDADLDRFTTGSWPFILVFAASIKFSKALASVSDEILKFFSRSTFIKMLKNISNSDSEDDPEK